MLMLLLAITVLFAYRLFLLWCVKQAYRWQARQLKKRVAVLEAKVARQEIIERGLKRLAQAEKKHDILEAEILDY